MTDAGQAGHFRAVFEAARRAGVVSSDLSLEHVPFGLVQGEDGKKFATRSRGRAAHLRSSALLGPSRGTTGVARSFKRDDWRCSVLREDATSTAARLFELGPRRSGETVRLKDLLDEAEARAGVEIREREATQDDPRSDAELDQLAKAVGVGAVKHPAGRTSWSFKRTPLAV